MPVLTLRVKCTWSSLSDKGVCKFISEKHSFKRSTLRPRNIWSFNQRLEVTYNSTLIRRDKWRFTLISKCTLSSLSDKGVCKFISEKHSFKRSTLRPRSIWSFNQRLEVTYNSTLIRRGKCRFTLISKCTWSLILRTRDMWIFTMTPNVTRSFTRVLMGTSVCEASRTLV